MRGGKIGKSDTVNAAAAVEAQAWPAWARGVVTALLAYHLAAIAAGALAGSPASLLEQRCADLFASYYRLVDQGYTYRYYAPEPGPTPVATAQLHFADGRPDLTIRLPDRALKPQLLRYQRQLALANHLTAEHFDRVQAGQPDRPLRWAPSYARHLCKTHPGCDRVTLFAQQHLFPDPERARRALADPGGARLDLLAEEFYTTPERLGDCACDAF